MRKKTTFQRSIQKYPFWCIKCLRSISPFALFSKILLCLIVLSRHFSRKTMHRGRHSPPVQRCQDAKGNNSRKKLNATQSHRLITHNLEHSVAIQKNKRWKECMETERFLDPNRGKTRERKRGSEIRTRPTSPPPLPQALRDALIYLPPTPILRGSIALSWTRIRPLFFPHILRLAAATDARALSWTTLRLPLRTIPEILRWASQIVSLFFFSRPNPISSRRPQLLRNIEEKTAKENDRGKVPIHRTRATA